jgi:hypothetical protein
MVNTSGKHIVSKFLYWLGHYMNFDSKFFDICLSLSWKPQFSKFSNNGSS